MIVDSDASFFFFTLEEMAPWQRYDGDVGPELNVNGQVGVSARFVSRL